MFRSLIAVTLSFAIANVHAAPSQDLISTAQKEGALVWYSTAPVAASQALSNAFQSKYGIQTSMFRGGTFEVYQRISAEQGSGRPVADTLADRILLMRGGQLVQEGTPLEIYRRPRNSFVAEFTGNVNVFEGNVVRCDNGHLRVRIGVSTIVETAGLVEAKMGDPVRIVIRPQDLEVHWDPPITTANLIKGRIDEEFFLGERMEYLIQPDQENELRLRTLVNHVFSHVRGRDVWLTIERNNVLVFPLNGSADSAA